MFIIYTIMIVLTVAGGMTISSILGITSLILFCSSFEHFINPTFKAIEALLGSVR